MPSLLTIRQAATWEGVKKQISQEKSNEESEKLICAPSWFLHRQTSIMWQLPPLTPEIKVVEGRGDGSSVWLRGSL